MEQFYIEQFPALADRRFLLMEDLIEAITTERNMSAVPIRTSPRSRLRERGDFLIERSSGVQMNLLHRARTGDIVSTPIRMGEQGQLFIDRWDELKAKPFSNVGILIFALKRVKGMSPAF